MQGLGPPGWGLDARLTTLPVQKIIVAKSKEVKTICNLAEFSKEGYGSKNPHSSSTLWNYSKCGVYTVESEAGC
jgi:hypothetical protein